MVETNTIKRILLFVFGCLVSRLFLVYIAKTYYAKYGRFLGYLALFPAVGFAYIYFTNSRKTGAEVFGNKIWWNNLRPIHSFLYFVFAFMSIKGYDNAYLILILDIIIGSTAFIKYHLNNSF